MTPAQQAAIDAHRNRLDPTHPDYDAEFAALRAAAFAPRLQWEAQQVAAQAPKGRSIRAK